MTKVYLVTDDDRWFFRSIVEARKVAKKVFKENPDYESADIYTIDGWNDEYGYIKETLKNPYYDPDYNVKYDKKRGYH